MSDDKKNESKVGYKLPPKLSRFIKGKSGNPFGRPKKPKTWTIPHHYDVLTKQLAETITVTKGGKKMKITKADALYTSILNTAIAGNVTAQKFIMQMIEKLPFEYKNPQSTEISPAEEALIREMIEDAKTFVPEHYTHLFEDEKPLPEVKEDENQIGASDTCDENAKSGSIKKKP